MNVLVMNPGGNSLKVELVSCSPSQQFAFQAEKLLSVTVEGIGKDPRLSIMKGKNVTHSEAIEAKDYGAAAANILAWLEEEKQVRRSDIECVGLRVVHGGRRFAKATVVTDEVEQQVRAYERLAPLHEASRSSPQFSATPLKQNHVALFDAFINPDPSGTLGLVGIDFSSSKNQLFQRAGQTILPSDPRRRKLQQEMSSRCYQEE